MSDFQLSYTGEQVNTAVGNSLVALTTTSEQVLDDATQQIVRNKIGVQSAAETNAALLAKAPAIVENQSGNLVLITDASSQPAVDLVSQIEPTQAGSGEPSPDNVRPISGWDSVTAQRVGKNLAGVIVKVGIATVSGTRMARKLSNCSSLFVQVKPGCYYTISRNAIDTNARFQACFTEIVASSEGSKAYNFVDGNNVLTITAQAPENAKYMYVYVDNTGAEVDLTQYTINASETALPYEPYTAQTITAELPETVYGGSLDWNTGLLTVDSTMKIFDGSSVTSYAVASTGVPYVITQPLNNLLSNNQPPDYSSNYRPVSGAPTSDAIRIVGGKPYIYDARFADIDTAKAILDAEKPQIVYKIASPYTNQLTPQQLELLKGVNNVWSTTGDTDLTYVADTKLYIDNQLAAIATAVLSN